MKCPQGPEYCAGASWWPTPEYPVCRGCDGTGHLVMTAADAVEFLAALNDGTRPAFRLNGIDLYVALHRGIVLWHDIAPDENDDEPASSVLDLAASDDGLLALDEWAALAAAAGDLPPSAGVNLAEQANEALVAVAVWLLDHAALAAARIVDDPPCGCPGAVDPEHGDRHTERAHRRSSCGGPSVPAPCGGCYDCLAAQHRGARP